MSPPRRCTAWVAATHSARYVALDGCMCARCTLTGARAPPLDVCCADGTRAILRFCDRAAGTSICERRSWSKGWPRTWPAPNQVCVGVCVCAVAFDRSLVSCLAVRVPKDRAKGEVTKLMYPCTCLPFPKCSRAGCPILVDEVTVSELLSDPQVLSRYQYLVAKAFVAVRPCLSHHP